MFIILQMLRIYLLSSIVKIILNVHTFDDLTFKPDILLRILYKLVDYPPWFFRCFAFISQSKGIKKTELIYFISKIYLTITIKSGLLIFLSELDCHFEDN